MKGPRTPDNEEYNPHNYKAYPLCSAILVVQDHDVDVYAPDGRVAIDGYSQPQTVVLVRTGDESRLSAPISFAALADKTPPLARPDAAAFGAVRVSISSAVHFTAVLQKREEQANPSFYHNPPLKLLVPITPDVRHERWYPASEDEYVAAVFTVGKYTYAEDHVRSAEECVRRREVGDPDWDDQERETRYGHIRM